MFRALMLVLVVGTCLVSASANASFVTFINAPGFAFYFDRESGLSPEVHVIGVYQTSVVSSGSSHPEGTAFINVYGTALNPVHLVLSSYEPTMWILDGSGLSYIDSILINGYHTSRVVGIDASKVTNRTGLGNYISACAYSWPSDSGGCDTPGLVSGVEDYFGAPISTFTGVYGGTDFSVTLIPVSEPATYALFGLALLGLFATRRSPAGVFAQREV